VKEAIFVRSHVAVVLPWLFLGFVIMRKCVLKWKADEKFKAWIAADPTSKTKAMCVVCSNIYFKHGRSCFAKPHHRQETQETHGIETVVSFCYTFPVF